MNKDVSSDSGKVFSFSWSLFAQLVTTVYLRNHTVSLNVRHFLAMPVGEDSRKFWESLNNV